MMSNRIWFNYMLLSCQSIKIHLVFFIFLFLGKKAAAKLVIGYTDL